MQSQRFLCYNFNMVGKINLNNTQAALLGILTGLILVGFVIFFVEKGEKTVVSEADNGSYLDNDVIAENGLIEPDERSPVDTPEPGDEPIDEDTAVPIDSSPIGEVSYRTFEVRGENNRFSPSRLIVNEGDSLVLNLFAVDSDYNLFIPDLGVFISASEGGNRRHIFQAPSVGDYEFYCRDICEEQTRGILIVNSRE